MILSIAARVPDLLKLTILLGMPPSRSILQQRKGRILKEFCPSTSGETISAGMLQERIMRSGI